MTCLLSLHTISLHHFALFALLCIQSVSCLGDFTLTLLHTNDVHSHFDEFNPFGGECTKQWQDKDLCFGGYPRLAWKVREIRQLEANVVVLDAGDQYQGTVWHSVFGHRLVTHFMNKLGYDAMALGNHEFDDGVEGLLPFLRNASFPVLSSNLDISREPRFHGLINDTIVLNISGEKIGVAGYITWKTKLISSPGPTLSFKDEVASLQSEVDRLLSQGVNKIIALGHSGYHTDLEIARQVRGLDIVIGGHTNTFLYTGTPPTPTEVDGPYPTVVPSSVETGRSVLVVQDYMFAVYLGYLKVTFNGTGDVVSWSGNPIVLNMSVPKDPELEADLQSYKRILFNRTSQVIGNTRVFMDNDHCKTEECNLGNFICDAIVYSNLKRSNRSTGWNDASICIHNAGGLRNALLEIENSGNITLRNLIDVLPFLNTLDVVEVRGDVIRDILEHSVSQPGHPRFLQVSGLKFSYNPRYPVGSRVSDIEVLCSHCRVPAYKELTRNASYRIITSTYLSGGGDGYSMLRDRRISYQEIGELDTDAVTDYLRHNTPLTTGVEGRIRIVNTPQGVTTTDDPITDDPTNSAMDNSLPLFPMFIALLVGLHRQIVFMY